MMKKALAAMLAAALMLSLAACGGSTSGNNSAADEAENASQNENVADGQGSESETQYYQLGDTVSTDIIEFTMDTAELAIALNNVLDENYGTPKEYNVQEDANNPFVAPKGHTYATFTYTIRNLDRTSFNGKLPFVTAKYGEEESSKQADIAEYSAEDSTWEPNGNDPVSPVYSWHFVLSVGEAKSFRSFIDLPVETDASAGELILTVELPVSDGTTSSFDYLIA